MIDIENYVFDRLAAALRESFPGISVVSRALLSPAEFPCVTVIEADSYVYDRSVDSGSLENHVWLMYEINVFTNRKNGAKEECRKIFAAADDVMAGLGFIRTGRSPVPEDDPTRYRLVGRYRGVAAANKEIYTR